jgi:hypothetical protein
MVFSSALFLFYFLPLFLAGYFLMPQRLKNAYLAFVSVAFYAWGAPNFLLIFLGSCLADYVLLGRRGVDGYDKGDDAHLCWGTQGDPRHRFALCTRPNYFCETHRDSRSLVPRLEELA